MQRRSIGLYPHSLVKGGVWLEKQCPSAEEHPTAAGFASTSTSPINGGMGRYVRVCSV